MGRHSRPTAAQQARATTLKAATALGVAGTIAIGLNSTVGGDKSVEARSDVNAQQAQAPDIEPTADHTPARSHVSPSESAKPKLISDHTDAATPGGGGTDRSAQHPTTHATPDAAPSKAAPTQAAPTPAQRDDQVPSERPSAPSESETTPSPDPTTPSQRPGEPSQPPGQGGHHGKGLVGGLVDGVGETLDGVLGGVGGVLGG
ncbi:extensin [Streptomyces sp. SID8361]|uniref:extensin n=1 Tax=Streptomyces TaxID=1883 RepID=UPI00081E2BFD|nr:MULTISPECIES: extensin [unclassified Streptomyces]AUA09283.1 hypothetical protein CFP59_01372 [Streptomyces sp. M56]MYU10398.1 extensin [Streptomyces sp. SID8361]MYX59418.1 extensin [Streptomyces sp. SID8382]SCF71577.1 hypothetical protein GA0115260_101645 [Streptomyces sp. MnatMP-M27]